MRSYTFEPIGFIRSCFTDKFGIPRQPGLVPQATATLTIEPSYSRPEAFRRLETFSHVWILFVFHQSIRHQWKTTVRPPRLGGNQRVGVFASRSGFRPNAIGQSALKLVSINREKGKIELLLGGVDLLDGTPVLDVKPYIPYADAIADATSGYAPDRPEAHWTVTFSSQAIQTCRQLEHTRYPGLKQLITDLVALDPRPGYQDLPCSRSHGMRLWDLNVRFCFAQNQILVETIDQENPRSSANRS